MKAQKKHLAQVVASSLLVTSTGLSIARASDLFTVD